MRCSSVVLLTCCSCFAQSVAVGVIGGARLTEDVSLFTGPGLNVAGPRSGFDFESKFYDVGPIIEIGVSHGLAVEFDALYHRQGLSSTFSHDTLYRFTRERDNTWEFPLLLKYKKRFSVLNPFVEAGVVGRTISGRAVAAGGVYLYVPNPLPPFSPIPSSYSPSVGFVTGGGLEFHLRSLRLAPQIRYTRWATAPVNGLFDVFGSGYSSNLNQLDMLVGVSRKIR